MLNRGCRMEFRFFFQQIALKNVRSGQVYSVLCFLRKAAIISLNSNELSRVTPRCQSRRISRTWNF